MRMAQAQHWSSPLGGKKKRIMHEQIYFFFINFGVESFGSIYSTVGYIFYLKKEPYDKCDVAIFWDFCSTKTTQVFSHSYVTIALRH